MVRFLKRGNSLQQLLRGGGRSSSTAETSGRHSQNLDCSLAMGEERGSFKVRGGIAERLSKSRLSKNGGGAKETRHPSDAEVMKEKFAKLLLGEDMSGGGKGVSSALALSNAITDLAASVLGDHRRLEPMAAETKARWKKEIDWLLSVTDHIVEFVPSQQTAKDGSQMEIMTTRQRSDLQMNIPALRKLDNMLLDCLENFEDDKEFWYEEEEEEEEDESDADRSKISTVKIPTSGLSEVTRKWLKYQKDNMNQVLKLAMAINAQVLSEMEIPDSYIESLPKNGRASLGDAIYRSITVESFNPEQFLSSLDLSTEHKVVDIKNRIEASVVIWKRKMIHKDGKSSWGSAVSLEKREQFEERAETILVLLKHRFPSHPQSALDISKIQCNKDIGLSVLESYSRILESFAYNLMSRIEDVLEADAVARNPSLAESKRRYSRTDCELTNGPVRFLNPEEEIKKLNDMEAPTSMTLLDFIKSHPEGGAQEEEEEEEAEEHRQQARRLEKTEDLWFPEDLKLKKPHNIITTRKFSFMETLSGMRSPTPRH